LSASAARSARSAGAETAEETFMTGVLLLSLIAGAIAAPAFAQAPAGPCKPVFDAMLKQTTTPHHIVTMQNGTAIGEAIATVDASYVKINGVWKKTPRSLKDTYTQQQENLRDITSSSCTKLPDDVVGGTAAVVYQVHYEQKDRGPVDAKIWIAKASGLPARTDVTTQAGQKVSLVTTLDYDHITAPPVQ
jgi:hypothetical protein